MTIEYLLEYLDISEITKYYLDGSLITLDYLKQNLLNVYISKFKIDATFKILDEFDIRYTYQGIPDTLPDVSDVILPKGAVINQYTLYIETLKGGE